MKFNDIRCNVVTACIQT